MENNQTLSACKTCGVFHTRKNRRGEQEEWCGSCEERRLSEINRISEYFEKRPDECCCKTYLGRDCCKSAIHGDWWKVNGIDNGERFYFEIRAANRKEA